MAMRRLSEPSPRCYCPRGLALRARGRMGSRGTVPEPAYRNSRQNRTSIHKPFYLWPSFVAIESWISQRNGYTRGGPSLWNPWRNRSTITQRCVPPRIQIWKSNITLPTAPTAQNVPQALPNVPLLALGEVVPQGDVPANERGSAMEISNGVISPV